MCIHMSASLHTVAELYFGEGNMVCNQNHTHTQNLLEMVWENIMLSDNKEADACLRILTDVCSLTS